MTDFITRAIDRVYGIRLPILVLLQVLLIAAANQAAFWLRFDGNVEPAQKPFDTYLLPLLIVVRLAVFFPLRLHQGIWRYTSIWDLRNIVIGVTISSVVFWMMTHWVLGIRQYPRSVFIIDSILLVCLMAGVRLTRRIHLGPSFNRNTRKVLLFGAGDAGEMLARDLLNNHNAAMTPLGFVDDDPRKVGQRIHGLPVLGLRKDLPRIIRDTRPDDLLIAIPSASRETLRDIIRAVEPFKLRITTLPRINDLMGARVGAGHIRQLKVEDLLAREPIGLDYEPVRRFLGNKRVLVTGAGGSIGSELCRQIAAAGPARLVLLDRYENGLFNIHRELVNAYPSLTFDPVIADVTDAKHIDHLFDHVAPQLVFHAAAHKHVPLMESNPCEAVKNNVRGTRIIAQASLRAAADRFILISTDKAVNPISVMGASKRVAELLVQAMYESQPSRFACVRFGNVLASNGSVVPTFLEQIGRGGPVTVTHPEMRRFFMLIPEAVQLVLHAATLTEPARVFILDMGEQVKVSELARDLIRLSGLVPEKDVEIIYTGIRPGEKLAEELVGAHEVAEPTALQKITMVRSTFALDSESIHTAVSRLEAFASDGNSNEVVDAMRSLTTGINRESAPV